MKYNRALDYALLGLSELAKGKGQLAARLMAKAVEQPDFKDAIRILESSNRQAFTASVKVSAKKVKAAEEFPAVEEMEEDIELDSDFEADPLDDIEDDAEEGDDLVEGADEWEEVEEVVQEAPAATMARLLQSMTRKTGKR